MHFCGGYILHLSLLSSFDQLKAENGGRMMTQTSRRVQDHLRFNSGGSLQDWCTG